MPIFLRLSVSSLVTKLAHQLIEPNALLFGDGLPEPLRMRVKETMKNKRKGYRTGILGVHAFQEPSLQPFR